MVTYQKLWKKYRLE